MATKAISDLLIPLDPVTITLATDLNPDEFFQTKAGLWVLEDFCRLVVDKAKPSKAGTVYRLNHAELTKNLTDVEVKAALPPHHHVFSETEVCAILAGLISQQRGGKEGILLNDVYASLLYTASCVVDVSWRAGDRGWYVCAWPRGGHLWIAGRHVLSPATDD